MKIPTTLLRCGLFLLAIGGPGLAQTNLAGDISDDTTGPLLAGQVYHLTGTVTVQAGKTLTAQEGAIVKGYPNTTFIVYGTLDVNGTAISPVIFTALADDSAGGDTNGDGASSGAPGMWRGLFLRTGATDSTIEYAEQRFGGQGGFAGIVVVDAGNQLDHVTVRDNSGAGVNLDQSASTLTNCAIHDNGGWAVDLVTMESLGGFSGNTAWGNALGDHERVTTIAMGADLTIGPDNCLGGVLVHQTSMFVPQGLSLTLEAGLIVKAIGFAQVVAGGQLFMNGTALDPIILTSIDDDDHGGDAQNDGPTQGGPGDWRGVFLHPTSDGSSISYTTVRNAGFGGHWGFEFNGTDSTLANCTILECSAGGIDLNGAAQVVSITDNVITDCGDTPITGVQFDSVPGLVDNQASGNAGGDYMLVNGYTGAGNLQIGPENGLGGTLVLGQGITIVAGGTLDLGAGLVLKAENIFGSFWIAGTLTVSGTGQAPVVFTSIDDDDYGGDTRSDGPTTGTPGQWRGFLFAATGDASVVDHAVVRYAGFGQPSMTLKGADMTLSNSVVRDGLGPALSLWGAAQTPTLTGNQFLDCTGIAADAVPLASLPGFSSNVASGNASDHTEVVGLGLDSALSLTTDNVIGDLLHFRTGMDLFINADLTIGPGMTIKMHPGSQITAWGGSINFLGTRLDPIRVTSYYDDSVFGDTDLGTGPPASHGDWRGIVLNNISTSVFRNVRLSYLGSNGLAGITVFSPTSTLQGVRVDHSSHDGFELHDLGSETERLVAYDCLERGIELVTGNFLLRQATSYQSGQEGIYAHPQFLGAVTDCISLNSGLDNYAGFAPGVVRYSNGSPAFAGSDGNIDEDPLFVNPGAGGLSLFEASPCVDTGDPQSPLDPDLTRADMGAFYFDHCRPRPFCQGKVNSLGCLASIGSSGYPDITGQDDLRITAANIVGQRTGYLMWSFTPNPPGSGGAIGASRLGLNLCLTSPQVLAVLSSGGTEGQCDGAFDVPISDADMAGLGWLAGLTVYTQFIYEDPGHPDGSGWGQTQGLLFRICP